jgi:hypothetical protein
MSAPTLFAPTRFATSDREGTELPRAGLFWGTRPPRLRSTVVLGELSAPGDPIATPISGWTLLNGWIEQTVPTTIVGADLRLGNFAVQLKTALPLGYGDADRATAIHGSFAHSTALHSIRAIDVAVARIPTWREPTESAWANVERLLASSAAVLTTISEQIGPELAHVEAGEHVGLAAVGWLGRTLRLSRPVVLRMASVPESTFYAWQKSPMSTVHTLSVTRLLRLQAEIGLLAQGLGMDGLMSWLLSGDRLGRLQGTQTEFEQVMAEAEEGLAFSTKVSPRRRMRTEDYVLDQVQPDNEIGGDLPFMPSGSKATPGTAK